MKFPKYNNYQQPESDWQGEIPKGWNSLALGRLFRRVKRTGFESEELLSVYRDHGVILKSSRDDNFNKPSDDLSPYQLVRPDELVMNKMKAWQGSIAISEYRGIVSPAYFVYESWTADDDRMYSRYIHYLLRSPIYIAQYLRLSKGIRVNQWDLDPGQFERIEVLLPSPDEQKQIAAFLDYETAKIDALIEKQQQLIALLGEKRQAVISHAVTKGLNPAAPMRDSGIDWLGEVPEHWTVGELKRFATVNTGVAKGKNLAGQKTVNVPYLRVANVQDGYLELDDVTTIDILEHELERYRLLPGDVLMNEGGDFDKLGRGDVWEGQIDPCITQNHVFAVRPAGMQSHWLSRITSSHYGQFYFKTRSKQSTNLASISSTNLMQLPVVVPPDEEQTEILTFIERSAKKFDRLLSIAEQQVELLQERRTALISAAVTGKIDVRGWKPPSSEVDLDTEMEVA